MKCNYVYKLLFSQKIVVEEHTKINAFIMALFCINDVGNRSRMEKQMGSPAQLPMLIREVRHLPGCINTP